MSRAYFSVVPARRRFALGTAMISVATVTACLFLWLVTQKASANQIPTAPDIVTVPEAPGSISGRITNEAGTPLAGIEITAYRTSPYYGWETARVISTTASGEYKLAILRTGNYRLFFHDRQGVYADEFYLNHSSLYHATDIPVVGNNVTDVNVVLAPAATITGSISVLNEVVPDYSYVTLYTQVEDSWFAVKQAMALTQTGEYSLPQVLAGVYRVCAYGYWDGEQFTGCYGGASLQQTTSFTVTTGESKADINIALGEGQFDGVISGTVTDDGQPVADIEVQLYQPYYYEYPLVPVEVLPGNHTDGTLLVTQKTDAQGQYTIGGLVDGTYRVVFVDPTETYATNSYADKPWWLSTDYLTIENGATISNVNASLLRAGRIRGNVHRYDGLPLANVRVRLFVFISDAGYYENWLNVTDYLMTDEDGNYEVKDLWPGVYRVAFESTDYYTYEYYGSDYDFYSATKITVEAGSTVADIDQTFGPDAVILLPIVASAAQTEQGSGR